MLGTQKQRDLIDCRQKWQASTKTMNNGRIANEVVGSYGSSYLSPPGCIDSRISGPDEAKNPAGGGCSPPDSGPFNDVEF